MPSTSAGIPYPQLTVGMPNVPADMQAMATALNPLVISVFGQVAGGGNNSVPSGAATQMTFPNLAQNRGNVWDSTHQQFTLPPGVYWLFAEGDWQFNTNAGYRDLFFNVSGVQRGVQRAYAINTASVNTYMTTSTALVTGATAYVQLNGTQTSGAAIGFYDAVMTVVGCPF